jgi:rhamnosyltransferase
LQYRQHDANVFGANTGLKARMARFDDIRSGSFRERTLAIADAVGDTSPITRALRTLGLVDRLSLAFRARQCRRRRSEALLLALFFLLMPRHPDKARMLAPSN